MLRYSLALVGLLALLLGVACGAPEPGAAPVATSEITLTPAETVHPASTVVSPGDGAPVGTPATVSPDRIESAAIEILARQLGVDPSGISVSSVVPKEWSNSALGCPEPGKAYAEVLSPGFLVRLASGGRTYEVHTDAVGKGLVCDRPSARGGPASTATREDGVSDPDQKRAFDASRRELARRTGSSPGEVELVSVEPKEWSDTSLGCPSPGKMYAQVITSGYLVTLRVQGREYAVHTDKGGRAVVCDQPSGQERDGSVVASLTRSGGLTGGTFTLVVHEDGRLELLEGGPDGRVLARGEGSPAQVRQLQRGLSSDAWRRMDAQVGRGVPPDGYTYTITGGGKTVETYDGVARPAALDSVLQQLNELWTRVPAGR
ncbi:MAG: hypothetical protein M3281_07270 [Chloroflexota bacterium]|nr:hypothetical protein [Chloroflexota bacterium]